MDAADTPASRALREAKEVLNVLNQLTTQAERGAAIDFDKANQLVASTSARLVQLAAGTVPAADALTAQVGTAASPTGGSGHGGPHARTGGAQTVSELQRRRAQQALTELQAMEDSLHRTQRAAQQRAGYASQLQELVGRGGAAAREDYSELEHAERERKGLQYARQRMQNMTAESAEVLRALQGQGSRLSATGDRLADMMESIGVSNATILNIVRRNQADAWLVYGGIVCLLFLLWWIW